MAVLSSRTVNSENYIVCHQHSAKLDGTQRLILCAHGASDLAIHVRTRPYCGAGDGRGVMHALADAGYIALACDFGGTTPFGNDTAITKVGQAVTWAQGTLGAKSGVIGWYGASMGALNLLNWTHANLSSVAAMAMHIPVVSLADYHDSNYGGTSTATVNTTYGGSGAYTIAQPTHDPASVASSYSTIPSKIWATTDDTINASTRTAFATSAGSTLSVTGTGGHILSTVDPQEVVNFLKQYV